MDSVGNIKYISTFAAAFNSKVHRKYYNTFIHQFPKGYLVTKRKIFSVELTQDIFVNIC
jgi:hypothetical protein